MLRILAFFFCLCLFEPAWAISPSGAWVLRIDGTAIFRFEIERTNEGWRGIWLRPEHFQIQGDAFRDLSETVVQRSASHVHEQDGVIELTFDDPRTNATPNIVRIRATDQTHAEATFMGLPLEPLQLERDTPGTQLGDWDRNHIYIPTIQRSTNAEMTAIFDADQKARGNFSSEDRNCLIEEDRKRRVRTGELIDFGALQSGDDFYHAAFIFQHGGRPEYYLKAHALATIAVARGQPAATWIAAATLDRYLQAIGKPQIFGTQFEMNGGKASQEPYDSSLISDALRKAMRVPSIAEQQQQAEYLEREVSATRK